MGNIIAICGKIASGKTYYVQHVLMKQYPKAVQLSCDELMTSLFPEGLGDAFDLVAARSKQYLHEKAAELCAAGCTVILDWGFWSKAERSEVTAFYAAHCTSITWHYVDITPDQWQQNIAQRNRSVAAGAKNVYAIDQGLLDKLLAHFEAPQPEEMDVWYTPCEK